jgi:hypothetical protein
MRFKILICAIFQMKMKKIFQRMTQQLKIQERNCLNPAVLCSKCILKKIDFVRIEEERIWRVLCIDVKNSGTKIDRSKAETEMKKYIEIYNRDYFFSSSASYDFDECILVWIFKEIFNSVKKISEDRIRNLKLDLQKNCNFLEMRSEKNSIQHEWPLISFKSTF